MNWYRLVLRDSDELEVDFAWRAAWKVAHEGTKPDHGHAIFRANGPGKSLILYFTPMEQTLAQAFGAVPCDKPLPTDLRLVVGHVRVWETYFPEYFQKLTKRREATERLLPSQSRSGFVLTHPFEPTHPLSQPAQVSQPGGA